MCAQAISFARIKRLYFGAYNSKGGGVEHGPKIYTHNSAFHKPEVYGGIQEQECLHILEKFFKKMFTFIDWCTISKNNFIKIGDDDSGKILQYGITETLVDQMKESSALGNTEAFFKEFGLAVRKDDIASYTVLYAH